jgi:hypothetical protein
LKNVRDFLSVESAKKLQLNHLAFAGVDGSQIIQTVIERHQIYGRSRRTIETIIQREWPHCGSTLEVVPRSGKVH